MRYTKASRPYSSTEGTVLCRERSQPYKGCMFPNKAIWVTDSAWIAMPPPESADHRPTLTRV